MEGSVSIAPSILFTIGGCGGILFFVLIIAFLLWRDRKKGRFSPFTENFFRLPGQSTRLCYGEIVAGIFVCYLGFIVLSVVLVWAYFYSAENTILFVVVLISLVCLCIRTIRLFKKSLSYRLGYEGEEFTGQELNLLMRKGAYVFHDIPYKYGNIDHIVIGMDKVFVIETKTFRKPKKEKASDAARQAVVVYDGKRLKFPHFSTSAPIEQAQTAANFVREKLFKKLGKPFTVLPVVALPGWYVECKSASSNEVLVINPKRGHALRKTMGQIHDDELRRQVVQYLAAVSRSYSPGSKIMDSDAAEKYDFWHNPKEMPNMRWDN